MDYPPNKNYEVVLNGLVVGTVDATVDIETDHHTIKELLIKKGLYKEVDEIKAMFRQAVSFSTAAAYLHREGMIRSPWDPFCVAPFVVNSAFSIELYLKVLLKIFSSSVRGHNLLDLYKALPVAASNVIKPAIETSRQKWMAGDQTDMETCVAEVANAFLEWRYLHEKGNTNTIRVSRIIFMLNVLHDACRSLPAVRD